MRGKRCGLFFAMVWAAGFFCLPGHAAGLPRRLTIAIDGISYRDMRALQEGVTCRDRNGRLQYRQAFKEGYYPASRNVSTFPSASDIAWTEIFNDAPPPGYQRTYYSRKANRTISINSFTHPLEFEDRMHWREESGYRRAMSFVYPVRAYEHEIREIVRHFLNTRDGTEIFYGLINATDDAQHMGADIFSMLCTLDASLRELRERYRASEGSELEILLISDHGNSRTGPPKRALVRRCLAAAGYRVTDSLRGRQDIVLPTVGMQSWVEVHALPGEIDRVVRLLASVEGVDLVTAHLPGGGCRFLVRSGAGETAIVESDASGGAFRYLAAHGDPLGYRPVVERLTHQGAADAAGFAPAAAWFRETISHRYPVALERIVRGHTRVTRNPAPILVSLANGYVHSSWLVKKGSELLKSGGSHGALDDVNSVGMLLSSFGATPDTCSTEAAGLFGFFPGRREFRLVKPGGVLTGAGPGPELRFRAWGPALAELRTGAPLDITIEPVPTIAAPAVRHREPMPTNPARRRAEARELVSGSSPATERVYAISDDLKLRPRREYCLSGRVPGEGSGSDLFRFVFYTDAEGRPAVD